VAGSLDRGHQSRVCRFVKILTKGYPKLLRLTTRDFDLPLLIGNRHYKCCEVFESAMHRLSPYGLCEPSARLTGRAWMYATDLPKRVSTLLKAASERDQHSPHHPHRLPPPLKLAPALSSPGYDPGLSTPSYDAALCIHTSNERDWWSPHTTWIVFVATRRPAIGYRAPPVAPGRPPLFSVPRRSLAPDGPTVRA
jgi:hypothetical protein